MLLGWREISVIKPNTKNHSSSRNPKTLTSLHHHQNHLSTDAISPGRDASPPNPPQILTKPSMLHPHIALPSSLSYRPNPRRPSMALLPRTAATPPPDELSGRYSRWLGAAAPVLAADVCIITSGSRSIPADVCIITSGDPIEPESTGGKAPRKQIATKFYGGAIKSQLRQIAGPKTKTLQFDTKDFHSDEEIEDHTKPMYEQVIKQTQYE